MASERGRIDVGLHGDTVVPRVAHRRGQTHDEKIEEKTQKTRHCRKGRPFPVGEFGASHGVDGRHDGLFELHGSGDGVVGGRRKGTAGATHGGRGTVVVVVLVDDTGELDQDQFEVALYVIMTIQHAQREAALEAARITKEKNGVAGSTDDAAAPTMRLEPHEAFTSFDNDQDGLLDQLEFNEALRSLGVVKSAPKDPLNQEADLKRLMDAILEEIPSGLKEDKDKPEDDPTRLVTFVQFLHGWIRSCNVPFEMKCRNVSVPLPTGGKGGGPLVQMKPKDALLQHVANAAKRQAELMAQARSQGWEMKRLARIEIERKRRAIEKQSEKENSEARKELALTEKSDRIAAKAANMQKFEAERR